MFSTGEMSGLQVSSVQSHAVCSFTLSCRNMQYLDIHAIYAQALVHPYTIRDAGFWTLGQFFSSVVQRCGVHVFQNQFKILMCLNTEQFYTLPQSNLNELWPREERVSVMVWEFGYFEFLVVKIFFSLPLIVILSSCPSVFITIEGWVLLFLLFFHFDCCESCYSVFGSVYCAMILVYVSL